MWFEQLVGFRETTGDEVRSRLSVVGETMVSMVNGREMGCGTLDVASLQELRNRTAVLPTGAGHLQLRQIVGDARRLHDDPANAGALFQAASQFNLLEMASPNVTPEDGVDGYEHDHTQGPACAIACGAGTILRNYFVDVNGRPGQRAHDQIDCLADLAGHLFPAGGPPWSLSNGYALFEQPGLDALNDRLAAMTPTEVDDTRARLRIGVHRNVEVTTAAAGHHVTQVYCSAIPVAYNRSVRSSDLEPIARLVLEATYEATLHAAVLNAEITGNRTVFLTMVGGGVFGNGESWIIDAVERACDRLDASGLDIVLVSYRAASEAVTALVQRR